jgi:hypothetical protein
MAQNKNFPPCPMCVRWWCSDCGMPHTNTADHRNLLPDETRACRYCKSTNGSFQPVKHYRRELHDEHARKVELEDSVLPHPRQRIADVAALVEMIYPLATSYRDLLRRSLQMIKGSRESNLVINTGHETLLKIDDTVRSWVADHPDEKYD